jgi:hypothetical protein
MVLAEILVVDVGYLRLRKLLAPLAALGLTSWIAPWRAAAQETPLAVQSDGLSASQALEVRAQAKRMRPLVTMAGPKSVGQSPSEVARIELARALSDNLARAKDRAGEADFAGCVEHAGRALGSADKIVGELAAFDLLRDLHVEIGVCLSLDNRKESALVHFTSATLLDEAPPKAGLYRSEAEAVREQARQAVLARSEGVVHVKTDPPGAKVSIDGRELAGVTPLDVHVRLGDHFVTFRRFRFEPVTELRFLQPTATLEVALEPARRSTLSEQLASLASQKDSPPRLERALAEASYSRAEQLLLADPMLPSRDGLRLTLYDAATGATLRQKTVAEASDDKLLHAAMCGVLGESCEEAGGIPWYVWPITGVGVAGGVLSVVLLANASRDVQLCPAAGC